MLKSSNNYDRQVVAEALYGKEFVQCVVYLATQGTGFSKQWLLKDLEVRIKDSKWRIVAIKCFAGALSHAVHS
jgi:hypothetical protein